MINAKERNREGAIKTPRNVIKKIRMWRHRHIAENLENCLLFLAFKALPCAQTQEECHGIREQGRPPFASIDLNNWLVRNFLRLSAVRLDRCCCGRCGSARGGIGPR